MNRSWSIFFNKLGILLTVVAILLIVFIYVPDFHLHFGAHHNSNTYR